VTPAKARKLITLGKPARFGHGAGTLTDPEVRDTWEIPAGLVRATWNPAVRLRRRRAGDREGRGLEGLPGITGLLPGVGAVHAPGGCGGEGGVACPPAPLPSLDSEPGM
jgi:hypothetical protein